MKKAAVLGYPISHSLSPKLHGFWLKQYGIEGSYEAIETPPGSLKETLFRLRDEGYLGCNLTVPLKEEVLDLLDVATGHVEKIGAANTIIFQGNKIHGHNTDVYGFIENINQQVKNWDYSGKTAFVLGAGGAARAVLSGLLEEGVEQILLTNRTLERAGELAAHFGQKVRVVAWEEKEQHLKNVNLLINTTILGMKNAFPLEISLEKLPEEALVCDIVYVPLETELLKKAKEKGCRTIEGLGMLLYQAVPAFELWFGKRPEVTTELKNYIIGT